MSCCGSQREGARGPVVAVPSGRADAPAPVAHRFQVQFEYTGPTGMTAVGAVTGQRYRFSGPGARVAVDARDRRSLLAVPRLREVS